MRSLALAALLATLSTAASASPPPACSMEGFAWQPRPEDLESRPSADWPQPKGDELCVVRSSSDLAIAGRTYRFTLSAVGARDTKGGFGQQIGAFLTIGRLEDAREVTLGRFAIPIDQAEGRDGAFDVQAVAMDRRIVISLMRTTPELFVIEGNAVSRVPNGYWAGELARVMTPQDVAGRILHFDLQQMIGHVAVHGARADEPASPGSFFAPRRAFRAELEWREGRIVLKDARIVTGANVPILNYADDGEKADRLKLQRRIGSLPAGTEPCWLSAWSADKDPKGLNVRAEPSQTSRILGQLAPPEKDPDIGETLFKEVTIIGYRKGWFLIDTKINAHEEQAATPKTRRSRWFEGRGWVSASMLGANTANSGFGEHKLFAAPTPFAHWTVGRQKDGDPLAGDSPIARIHACSWNWALVQSEGGQRGWRRALCSNQLTTCS